MAISRAACALRRVVLVAGLIVHYATAASFLARLSEPELQRALLAEIEAALGGQLHDATRRRLGEIEESLRPTFGVLPKDSSGRLGHDGVRYLLNRFFAQQHGWFVNGLHAGGDAWNSSSRLSMRDHLPEVLQELFEQKLGQQGAGLREVAVFAAMVEHLIQDELRGKLELIYEAKQVALHDSVDAARALNLMEAYMICFLQGQEPAACLRQLPLLERYFGQRYSEWPQVKSLIREVLEASPSAAAEGLLSFQQVSDLLQIVAERFSGLYQGQCKLLEASLVELEERGAVGRVPLASFYKAALHHGKTSFLETPEVLRSMGALDETDSSQPSVIIPNYVSGLSNCVARTSFYSTCCPSRCETMLDRIESRIGKAEATVDEIFSVVAELPVPGVDVKNPSAWLRRQLAALSQHHGGRVPLHGRLFRQWMHFMFPRDCMYPHLAGSTYKKSLDEWAVESGLNPQLSVQQLREVTEQLRELRSQVASENFTDAGSELDSRLLDNDDVHHAVRMWTMEEELLVAARHEVTGSGEAEANSSWSRPLAALAVVVLLLSKVGFLFRPRDWQLPARCKASTSKYSV
eukprot:TRINITY_DN6378_c0_g1_i2.p1 TRINITY_DN6378_c0_g1~~TRINITY_DN6378_c0_g1_i2.p1  ORF type:complete len:578 (-),score=133.24 TRINITY_DN6378_c0_g1_i2:74-1807(-)